MNADVAPRGSVFTERNDWSFQFSGPNFCPECGSQNVDPEEVRFGEILATRAKCNVCWCRGRSLYQ